MGIGKYSPFCPNSNKPYSDTYRFNCYGEVPAEWNKEIAATGVIYDEKTMYPDYDDEGFDSYGYSAFDTNGNYVGHGSGIDRLGYTEMEYLIDSANGGNLYYDGYSIVLDSFIRNRC